MADTKNDSPSTRPAAQRLQSTTSSFTLVRQSKASLDIIQKQSEAQEWIQSVLNFRFNDTLDFASNLEDGVNLCRLAMAIKPGSIKKVNPAKARFKMMENLNFFLGFCKEYGLPFTSMFHPLDIVERQNVAQIVICIHALSDLSAKRGFTPVMEKLIPDSLLMTNTRKNIRLSSAGNLFDLKANEPPPKQEQKQEPASPATKPKKKATFAVIDEPVFDIPKSEPEKEPKTEPAKSEANQEKVHPKEPEPVKSEPIHEEVHTKEKSRVEEPVKVEEPAKIASRVEELLNTVYILGIPSKQEEKVHTKEEPKVEEPVKEEPNVEEPHPHVKDKHFLHNSDNSALHTREKLKKFNVSGELHFDIPTRDDDLSQSSESAEPEPINKDLTEEEKLKREEKIKKKEEKRKKHEAEAASRGISLEELEAEKKKKREEKKKKKKEEERLTKSTDDADPMMRGSAARKSKAKSLNLKDIEQFYEKKEGTATLEDIPDVTDEPATAEDANVNKHASWKARTKSLGLKDLEEFYEEKNREFEIRKKEKEEEENKKESRK